MTIAGAPEASTPPHPPVRLIGLTEGIATGKSTVAGLLAARGAVVIDSDRIAREIVAPGSEGLAAVIAEFGPGVLRDGALDRAALGGLVFGDLDARRRLEAITHPRIRALSAERTVVALDGSAPLVVLDIPLLYETGAERLVEGVMVAWCRPGTQLVRLRERDGIDDDAARARVAAQLPVEEKRRRATWVIDNDGGPGATADAVAAWWERWVRAD